MRISISIPNEFYLKAKASLPEKGYTTLNDLILDALRHQIGVIKPTLHQSDAPHQIEENKKTETITVRNKQGQLCKHGYLRNLCKHAECRQ